MIYMLDTANINEIRHFNEFYPISGVTTNPTIISKENKPFWELLYSIREIIGNEKILFVQTVQATADGMIKEAVLLKEKLGGDFCIKIPMGEEGLKATTKLKRM